MIPNAEPTSHAEEYEQFWNKLKEKQSKLSSLFPDGYIGVEWGCEPPGMDNIPTGQLRDDEKITRAQNFINEMVSFDKLRQVSEQNNIKMPLDFPNLSPVVRAFVVPLRESIITCGLGDVVYYCSLGGEKRIRRVVYGKVLQKLDPYLEEQDVRIHMIGQSLGVTLTYDFLYGLFAREPGYEPGFYKQGEEQDIERFKKWRDKAGKQELKLGSLTSTASQLPLFVMRKQEMVDLLANKQPLQAIDIGIVETNKVKWKIFYDIDDLLGFATRRLYDSGDAIMDIQVDISDNPGKAHIEYWKNKQVIEETAKLLLENAQK